MGSEPPVSTRLREQFLKEAADRLKDLEKGLLNIEQGRDPDASVRLIFRGFHGLKGISAYVNAREIIDLTNAGETLLTQVRDDRVPFRAEWVDILLGCHDELKKLLDSFGSDAEPAATCEKRSPSYSRSSGRIGPAREQQQAKTTRRLFSGRPRRLR